MRRGFPVRHQSPRQEHHAPLALEVTPACAGKSASCRACLLPGGDHPRVCGEKTPDASSTTKSIGSPPRMRGKGSDAVLQAGHGGITPACAGKSAAQSLDRLCAGDHPRVCGEKVSWGNRHQEGLGSPPRMRGKVISSLQCDFLSGITPACAGKSCPDGCTPCPARDHPRVCGEKSGFCQRSILHLWITPACAGKRADRM